jgi:hypothetical protein
MGFFTRSQLCLVLTILAAGALAVKGALTAAPEESPFLEESKAAMAKMMAEMEITASGDTDRDFAAMMIPHHLGAIEMAQAELRHGRNVQLRRMAQEIIIDQQQEIAAMRMALGERLPVSAAAPDQPSDLALTAPKLASATTTKICTGSLK